MDSFFFNCPQSYIFPGVNNSKTSAIGETTNLIMSGIRRIITNPIIDESFQATNGWTLSSHSDYMTATSVMKSSFY